MTSVLSFAEKLIRIASVTPKDGGCQLLIKEFLEPLGFSYHSIPFEETSNAWYQRGSSSPLIVFAGHTDVVPAGNESEWLSPPFEPTIKDANLYGRGIADMKGALAAMLVATQRFVDLHPRHIGSIGFLLTSAEEGSTPEHGTPQVLKYLQQAGQVIDYCIVGEPTCVNHVGDMIKNGRRGSLSCEILIQGKQGHVAYPHRANNAIHLSLPFFNELLAQTWDDEAHTHYDPTSLQIVNISSGLGVSNVIPGTLSAQFNFRYSPNANPEQIKDRVTQLLKQHHIGAETRWMHYAEPFYTPPGVLIEVCAQVIKKFTGHITELSTSGGSSDARYIAKHCAQVIELGLVNATIHQVNEHVAVADLEILAEIYYQVLENLLK